MRTKTPDFVKTDRADYIRSTKTKALLNIDHGALKRSRAVRAKSREQESLKYRFSALQNEVSELRQLVTQLLNRNDGT